MELVRVTEAAALASGRHQGRGDKEAVLETAAEAMVEALGAVNMDGELVVVVNQSEGITAAFQRGARFGQGAGPAGRQTLGPQVDLAAGPIDGVSLVSRGLPGAITVVAACERGLLQVPRSPYMRKIMVGARATGAIDIDDSVENNLHRIAFASDMRVSDLTVVLLDRPRHQALVEETRAAGARVSLISDGEVASAVMAALDDSGVDVVLGIGSVEDTILAACALRCLGGELQAKPWARGSQDAEQLVDQGVDFRQVFTVADLAGGAEVVFAATGVTDGLLLQGVRYHDRWAESESLVMRSQSGSLRRISTRHHYALSQKSRPVH
jgi:fructose-1,6-bisphosphatase II